MSTICSNEPPCVPQPGTCLYYSGNVIVGPNIQNGDNFNTVINKLNNYINTLGVNVLAENLGVSGPVIYAQKVGNTFQFKRVLAGDNITIDETSTSITINASTAGAVGDGGILILNGLAGTNQSFVTGTAGSDFNISSAGSTHTFNLPIANAITSGKLSASDWTLFYNKVGSAVSLGFGEAVYKQQVGTTLQFKSINVTGGLAISSTGDEIIIDASGVGDGGEVATMINLGTVGGRIYSAKIGSEFQLRRVAGGTGITVTENATQVVVTNSAPDVPVVINGGTNINVSGTYPNFTISATDTGEANTMENIGGGLGIYSTKVGMEFKMRTLVAAAGITMAIVGDTIEIGAGAGVADGNNYPTSLDLTSGVLTLGRFGLSNLTTLVTTDGITEGVTNLFYTDARVYGSLTGGTGITVNPGTGEITNTGIVTADNGLTKTGNNVQLGGVLVKNTTIDATSVYDFIITSNRAGSAYTLKVDNTGTGIGLYATSVSNSAVEGFSVNGSGIYARSTNGFGLTAVSGVSAADLQVNNATTSAVVNALYLSKFTTGSAGIGHGISYTMGAETSTGNADVGLTFAMDWTTIVGASRTSRMTITLVDTAVDKIFMRGLGSGQMVLPQYGDNLFTGTPTYGLAVDTNGNVIEVALGGGAVVYTADNGLTMTANNTQLGGSLIQNTTIAAGASYSLTLTGSVSGAVLNVNASGANAAAFTNTNAGGVGSSHTSPNIPLWSINDNVSTNTVETVFNGSRTPATGAFGLGLRHQYNLSNNAGSTINIGGFRYYWTDAVAGSEKAEYVLSIVHNGSVQDRMTIASTGALKLNAYGSGSITGTPFRQLAVDAAGNVIEIALSGGGGELTTASNGLNLNGYDVKLGGVLTDTTTTITGSSGKKLVFTTTWDTIGSGQAGFEFHNTLGSALALTTVYMTNAATANGTVLRLENLGSGGALVATSTVTTAISATATTATAISAQSTSGTALSTSSTTGRAGTFNINPATTSSIATVISVSRNTSGAAAAGIGAAILFNVEDDVTSTAYETGQLAFKWLDVTHATHTAQFELFVTNNGSAGARKLFVTGTGYLGLDTTPQNDDALTHVLVYDTVSKLVKYRTAASLIGATVFASKTDITTNANWNVAYDASAGIALHEVLKVGDSSANDLRTITINSVFYITQANFTTGAWVSIGTTTYNPQNTVYFRGSTRIDATKFEDNVGTTFAGFNLYDDMNIRVDATGDIYVYIPNVTSYATLSGGNIVIVPVHITYFVSLAS